MTERYSRPARSHAAPARLVSTAPARRAPARAASAIPGFPEPGHGHHFGRVRVQAASAPLVQRQEDPSAAAAASTQPASSQSAASQPASLQSMAPQNTPATIPAGTCTPEREQLLQSRFVDARAWAATAMQQVDVFLAHSSPDTDPKTAAIRRALDRYFFHPKPGAELPLAERQKHARKIRDGFGSLDQPKTRASLACAAPGDPDCGIANAHTSRGLRRTYFCESYFTIGPTKQTFVMLHELIHASVLGTDLAYGSDRLFLYLEPERALTNPDSYALFAADMSAVAGGTEPLRHVRTPDEDDVSDCDAIQNDTVHRDFAHVEVLLFDARRIMNDLSYMPALFEKHFGSRDAGDHETVVERLRKANEKARGRLSFACEQRCRDVPGYSRGWFGSTLHLCPGYFAESSAEQRQDRLLALFVAEALGLNVRTPPEDRKYARQSPRQAAKNPFVYAAYARDVALLLAQTYTPPP